MIILITWCMSLKIKDTYLIIVGLGKEVISVKTAPNIFSDLPQSNFSAAPTLGIQISYRAVASPPALENP